MNFGTNRLAVRLADVAAAGVLALAATAHATSLDPAPLDPAPAGAAGAPRSFVSITPIYQGRADLDAGGDVKFGGVGLRGGFVHDFGGGTRAGITLVYDYLDYSFTSPNAFRAAAPWGTVQRYGVAAPLSFAVGGGWTLGVTPAFEWFRENGADTGDAFTWGATLAGSRRFADGNMIGVGVGVYDSIEETSVFPFLVVDWRLGDRWRLVNPLASGPTGPAGLELDYEFDNGWTAGVGAAWRVLRFRLNDSGPVPGGIGEERGMPLFVRLTYRLGTQAALHLYGGVVINGQLRVEDSAGGRLRQDDVDPAPLFGGLFIGRF